MEQRVYGIILIVCGLLAMLLLNEVSGAGILLILMGIARAVFKDEEEEYGEL